MRIAIIRGQIATPWEMQNFEDWLNRHRIVCFCSTENFYDISNVKIPVKRLPPLGGDPEQLEGLEEELKNFDIAFVGDIYWYSSAQTVRAAKHSNLKVVVYELENIPFAYEEKLISIQGGIGSDLRTVIRNRGRRGADFFICATERAKEALLLEGVPEDKLKVVRQGVDVNIFKPRPKLEEAILSSFRIERDDLVVFFNGQYRWENGVYELIYAIKRLIDDPEIDRSRLKFLFLGQGSEWEGMKWLITKLGVTPFIRLLSQSPYHLLPDLYNLADIFVLPGIPQRNRRRQINYAFMEAMACGLPVVSTYCGSTPELIGEAGILAEPADHLSLYQALKKLILDKSLRRELGLKGRRMTEQVLNAKLFAREAEKIFENLLSKREDNREIAINEIEELYLRKCRTPSDINEHLPTIRKYAAKCEHVTEMGVRAVFSTWALLASGPKNYVGYDIHYHENIRLAESLSVEHSIKFTFVEADTAKVRIDQTDLLLLDTWHAYEQLRAELKIHSDKVNKYIIMHDTTAHAYQNEQYYKKATIESPTGLWPAITEFLEANSNWKIAERFTNNNGLTILERVS